MQLLYPVTILCVSPECYSYMMRCCPETWSVYTKRIPAFKRLIIVPTFDTKVTEYLCSGWVFFFFRQISTF